MNTNELIWHDGLITKIDLSFAPADAICRIQLSLPLEMLSKGRAGYCLIVTGLSRFHSNLDVTALMDNARAGHIADAKLYEGTTSRLILFLADGYIEVVGSAVECQSVE